MQSTLEKLEGLACRLKISVPKEEVEQSYDHHLTEAAKTANIKGFRPGKVPINIIKSRLGPQIQQDVFGEIMQTSLQKAVDEHKLQIAGQPRIQPKKVVLGEALEYEAVFETFPQFTLTDLSGVTIEKLSSRVNDDDVKKMIEKLQKEQANWVTVDRAARDGDRLVLDFEGFIDDKPIEQGSAKNFSLILGSKQMIPGFEKSLIGAEPNKKPKLKLISPRIINTLI